MSNLLKNVPKHEAEKYVRKIKAENAKLAKFDCLPRYTNIEVVKTFESGSFDYTTSLYSVTADVR